MSGECLGQSFKELSKGGHCPDAGRRYYTWGRHQFFDTNTLSGLATEGW